MTRIIKNLFIFSLMLLPVAAFADLSSTLNFFNPPSGDFSLSLLERTFGTVSGVLHGRGNQIIGIILGVFNALWVIVIGLGILFVVWDSVMTAAQNGELMQQGRGKKTVFTILRIVIGFALVVPSKSTGYSMAQSGVMWVVVQGVGLADQITQKLHDYLQAGGQAFTTTPSDSADIAPLMPIAANILKSEICMYKLQDIVDKRNKARSDALKESGATDAGAALAKIGYSINSGATFGTVTFGSENPNYDPANPAKGNKYLNECGDVEWRLNLNLFNRSDYITTLKTLGGYMRASVTEMVLNLQPIARDLASADVDSNSNGALFQAIAQRAAVTMAGTGVSYATLLDPVKKATNISKQTELKTTLSDLNNKGWIFTPMMVIAPGMYSVDSVSLLTFMPWATPADVKNSTAGIFKELDETEKEQISNTMLKVDSDDYVTKATEYLKLMDDKNIWPKLDFTALYTGHDANNSLNGFDVLFDPTKQIMNAGEKTANGLLWVPKGMLIGVDKLVEAFGGDSGGIQDAIDALDDAQSSTRSMVDNATKNLDNLVADIKGAKDLAKKGGMTEEFVSLTQQLGPLGPLYATIMTAMIGKSMNSLEDHLFDPTFNAMASSIQVGGEMMVSAMESSFKAGKILFVATLVQAGIDGLGKVVGAIPYVGGAVSGIMGVGSNLIHKGIESFTTFHIALAVMLFSGGLLLYIVVPLTFVVAFAAVCLRWIGMVMINMLGAPIFCFNLIRSDGEGLIGRGEKFLADLAKTALTPAILAIGAVAFLILFNIGYILITSILTQFIPVLASAYNNPILVPVALAIILMVFATLMVYISQTLATLCTTELVSNIASTIHESIHGMQDQSPASEIKSTVHSGGQQGAGTIKSATSTGSGMGPKI